MVETTNLKISAQRDRVFGKHPEMKLEEPCKVGNGILRPEQQELANFRKRFEREQPQTTFFVPASGSGSRMFQFLHDFLTEPAEENRSLVERFLNHISDFAFYRQLPPAMRRRIEQNDIDLEEFVSFLLNAEGMGYSDIPKGIIPFHSYGPFILNPIQEHILQGNEVNSGKSAFHFTIQPVFEKRIEKAIGDVEGVTGNNYAVNFSCQDPETNAIAFAENGEPVMLENGKCLERPAGHGALLSNLNGIDSDLVFIRNVDNVQHFSRAEAMEQIWKLLGGICLEFREKRADLLETPTLQGVIDLNERYQLFQPGTITSANFRQVLERLERPTRVCGMVKNEGQAGGGPFWVKDDAFIEKQIVEKAQISRNPEQYKLMVRSSHFNPVLIALDTRDPQGNKYDLARFCDESQFFVVHKKFKGMDIRFCELPGLWNGSMAHWNTIFVEVPSDGFSPVKTVLDLLGPEHRHTL